MASGNLFWNNCPNSLIEHLSNGKHCRVYIPISDAANGKGYFIVSKGQVMECKNFGKPRPGYSNILLLAPNVEHKVTFRDSNGDEWERTLTSQRILDIATDYKLNV